MTNKRRRLKSCRMRSEMYVALTVLFLPFLVKAQVQPSLRLDSDEDDSKEDDGDRSLQRFSAGFGQNQQHFSGGFGLHRQHFLGGFGHNQQQFLGGFGHNQQQFSSGLGHHQQQLSGGFGHYLQYPYYQSTMYPFYGDYDDWYDDWYGDDWYGDDWYGDDWYGDRYDDWYDDWYDDDYYSALLMRRQLLSRWYGGAGWYGGARGFMGAGFYPSAMYHRFPYQNYYNPFQWGYRAYNPHRRQGYGNSQGYGKSYGNHGHGNKYGSHGYGNQYGKRRHGGINSYSPGKYGGKHHAGIQYYHSIPQFYSPKGYSKSYSRRKGTY